MIVPAALFDSVLNIYSAVAFCKIILTVNKCSFKENDSAVFFFASLLQWSQLIKERIRALFSFMSKVHLIGLILP